MLYSITLNKTTGIQLWLKKNLCYQRATVSVFITHLLESTYSFIYKYIYIPITFSLQYKIATVM